MPSVSGTDGNNQSNNLEQFVYSVEYASSRYNTSNSYYYSPSNLEGKYVKYPSYGDFPETYFLRSYGNWWKKSEAYQGEYRPQDVDPFGAEDYIIVDFANAVVPREICIYEIYNPGALVRIWAKTLTAGINVEPWCLLWEGPPQTCPPESRKFQPPLKQIKFLVKTIRLEFNQSHLQYHYSIDAVLLAGHEPQSELYYNLILHMSYPYERQERRARELEEKRSRISLDTSAPDINESNIDFFSCLPYEVILHIFQYLDLKSLSRCAQVNKTWNAASADPVLYQSISLKPYWNLIGREMLEHLIEKCVAVKRLDVTWCGEDLYAGFSSWLSRIIGKNSPGLTHLSMSNNIIDGRYVVMEISTCEELTELRMKDLNPWPGIGYLNELHKLVTIDFSLTGISDTDIISILKANPNVKHIILDQCEKLVRIDDIIDTIEKYNKQLTTWSSWKTSSITVDGVKKLANCSELTELDLGWCVMNSFPGDCIEHIAKGCKKLKRLILSEWRGLNDHLLRSVLVSCRELTQLDLLGIKDISADFCERALFLLPKLRLLDISYCDSIDQREVEIWRQQYPHITIQRSCQYFVDDYLN